MTDVLINSASKIQLKVHLILSNVFSLNVSCWCGARTLAQSLRPNHMWTRTCRSYFSSSVSYYCPYRAWTSISPFQYQKNIFGMSLCTTIDTKLWTLQVLLEFWGFLQGAIFCFRYRTPRNISSFHIDQAQSGHALSFPSFKLYCWSTILESIGKPAGEAQIERSSYIKLALHWDSQKETAMDLRAYTISSTG